MKTDLIKRIRIYYSEFLYSTLLICILTSCQRKKSLQLDSEHYGFDLKYESIIDSIINLLTLEEKVYMVHDCGIFISGGVERLGIPELHLA